MARRTGSRAGRTAKRRDQEIRSLEEEWRAKGLAVNSADKRKRDLQRHSERLVIAWRTDGNLPKPISDEPWNETMILLTMLVQATGKSVFSDARDEMLRLGLHKIDYLEKLSAQMPTTLAELTMGLAFSELLRMGHSNRQAAEILAVEFEVPASSFDAARQQIRRQHIKAKRKPRPPLSDIALAERADAEANPLTREEVHDLLRTLKELDSDSPDGGGRT